MALFNKAEKTNTTISLGTSIYQVWGWLGGASMLGSVLGWFSPIVDVLGKPLSAVVGAILLILLYAIIKKAFFENKQRNAPQFVETFWEITYVNGVRHTINHPNIRNFWGFNDFYALPNGLFRAYCVLSFISPIKRPKIDIKAKNGEIILQNQLGIREATFIDNDDGMVYGISLVIEGEINVENSRYIISLLEQ